ncbi:YIP1 family protein [Jannaschia sp. S6380]|uniref:YIP1 family protein n=1 Tax=Jannaschia sp. S6380 TaxID=2926408 RepID=UPI001FF46F2D|nr:YIP1 family protein [Jannaschia sp. S6380]MCK0166373.1 YIP1 family protein [Jannaschia sp. S6380]
MSVTRDIPRAWLRPRQVMAEHLSRGVRDDTAFVFLLTGCLIVFVAQMPRLSRQAHLTGEDFVMLMGGTLMAWVFVAPLLFYVIAFASHLVTRAFRGRGDPLGARIALFWTLLAISPAMLLHGLTAGFVGPSPALTLVGIVALGGFVWIWLNSLYIAEYARV